MRLRAGLDAHARVTFDPDGQFVLAELLDLTTLERVSGVDARTDSVVWVNSGERKHTRFQATSILPESTESILFVGNLTEDYEGAVVSTQLRRNEKGTWCWCDMVVCASAPELEAPSSIVRIPIAGQHYAVLTGNIGLFLLGRVHDAWKLAPVPVPETIAHRSSIRSILAGSKDGTLQDSFTRSACPPGARSESSISGLVQEGL